MIDEENFEYDNSLNTPIFKGSNLNLKNLNLLLALFTSRFNISFKCADELLKFLQLILPQPNNLNKKFNTIIEQIEISNQSKLEYLCSSCWENKKSLNEACNNIECEFYSQQKESIEVYLFDITQQLNEVIKREHETMNNYKEVFMLFLKNDSI